MKTHNTSLTVEQVGKTLGHHLDFYKHKAPHYQTRMLNSLLSVWQGHHAKVLDIGGGTGVIGQCIKDFFPVGSVEAVDVVDRFCPTLDIATRCFDGRSLPFADASFDAATLNNVIHHVPVEARSALLGEVARVVRGPVYIKDHEARSTLDHLRLSVLDLLGNAPFGGMIRAHYLSGHAWQDLAQSGGFRIATTAQAEYRFGAFALLFPNRLETTMRWERA